MLKKNCKMHEASFCVFVTIKNLSCIVIQNFVSYDNQQHWGYCFAKFARFSAGLIHRMIRHLIFYPYIIYFAQNF